MIVLMMEINFYFSRWNLRKSVPRVSGILALKEEGWTSPYHFLQKKELQVALSYLEISARESSHREEGYEIPSMLDFGSLFYQTIVTWFSPLLCNSRLPPIHLFCFMVITFPLSFQNYPSSLFFSCVQVFFFLPPNSLLGRFLNSLVVETTFPSLVLNHFISWHFLISCWF